MKAPQNLHILGMTSKTFSIEFVHKIKTENFQLFIESILSDLMDAIGNTFKATISLHKTKDGWTACEKSSISLEFPEYQWLSDVGTKISEFVKKHDEFRYVTVGFVHQESYKHNYITFSLIAKDGVYIEKKMTSVDMTTRTIKDDSWCNGHEVVNYTVQNIDF
jgi:hypothetical protein